MSSGKGKNPPAQKSCMNSLVEGVMLFRPTTMARAADRAQTGITVSSTRAAGRSRKVSHLTANARPMPGVR